jgi:hypothetical protein
MPRQNWPARWCGRLGGALRYSIYVHYYFFSFLPLDVYSSSLLGKLVPGHLHATTGEGLLLLHLRFLPFAS